MTNLLCAKPLQGETLRVTRLDSCGEPDYGECAYGVSEGYVQAQLTPNVESPDEFKRKGPNGKFIVNQRSRPLLNWFDVSIQFQEVDPEIFTIITGLDAYEDDQDRVIGFVVNEDKFATANFALELWLGNAEEECSEDDDVPYGYSLLPWVVEGAIAGNITVANQLITFTVEGRTRKGTPWGTGPYDVVVDQAGSPSPLFSAIPTDTHDLQIWTFLAPPEAECGCQSLAS
ncbi:MAG: hypothetical protein ACOC96_10280 [Actinomycetota bacterium]